MSLEDKLNQHRRAALIEYLQENPDMTFGELLDDSCDEEVPEIFNKLTFAALVSRSGTEKKTETDKKAAPKNAAPKKSKTSRPRLSTAHINSEYMRWRNAQNFGNHFSMAEICEQTNLTPQQVKKAMKNVGGMEKNGIGPSTVYVVVEKPQPDEDDDDEPTRVVSPVSIAEGRA